MLAIRVIPVVLYDGQMAVKPRRFARPARPVGQVSNVAQVYESRQVDEIVFLSLACLDPAGVETFASTMMCPVTAGGGVFSVADATTLLRSGADKVCVDSALWDYPDEVRDMVDKYGSQAIVASVNARRGRALAWGSGQLGDPIVDWCKYVASLGVGEILLTDADREGTKRGYNVGLIRSVRAAVSDLPIIAHGGAGKPDHAPDAIKAGASAVAAATMFHFTRYTPADVTAALAKAGYPTRSRA